MNKSQPAESSDLQSHEKEEWIITAILTLYIL